MATMTMYISSATKENMKGKVEERLDYWANELNLERALVHAVSWVESKKNPLAMRFEPALKTKNWYKAMVPKEHRTNDFSYYSMGLMQCLYGVAVSQGFKGKPTELLDIDNGIEHGCRKIKALISKYYYLDKVISAYNQGSPRTTVNEAGQKVFRNQSYVDKVLKKYKSLGGRY